MRVPFNEFRERLSARILSRRVRSFEAI